MTNPIAPELPYRIKAIRTGSGRGKRRSAGKRAPHADGIAQSPKTLVLTAVPGIRRACIGNAALGKSRTARRNECPQCKNLER